MRTVLLCLILTALVRPDNQKDPIFSAPPIRRPDPYPDGRRRPGTRMHIQDIFRQHPTTISFEFFPPKTDEASAELFRTIASMQALKPSFVSVTYGAGGSDRQRTHDLVVRI